MDKSRFTKSKIPTSLFINLTLFTVFFTLYYVISTFFIPQVISKFNENPLVLQAIFSIFIALSLFLSSHFIKKLVLKHVLVSLTILVFALILLFFSSFYLLSIFLIFTISIFFGIGQLASYTYFWNTTKSEERGRVGGLIGFIALPFFFIANYGLASSFDFFGNVILCMGLCFIGLLIILLNKFTYKKDVNKSEIEYYPEKRAIILYSVPWIIFSLLNATLAKNISAETLTLIPQFFYLTLIGLQTVFALIGALSGGFIADYFGRRLTLALSVSLYGISVIFRGFINSELTFIIAFIAEGLSWGILLTLYSFVIWGDLSNKRNVAKLYALGLIIFYLAVGIGQIPSFISTFSLLSSTLISCLLIFFSNIPIALAPELLSFDIQEKLHMKKYLKTIKKIAEKNQG